ncbi:EF-hand domain-containing protein [Allorhizobium sp. BGMRC 0089]|uniref:EF-hand domain-containing protein n=1 Tax=Allorhizobium sonneratiae TaxID=2934936 RepID=UPI00203478AB|nr:EF-hand domain-containing protein [Allorhizobium sonneratiae]MCM2291990.1 EF-hand domain-containing protein [Allorhizobium sonneratiae]
MTSVSSSTASSILSNYTTGSTNPLDTNGDGVVSADELAAASSTRTQDPTVSTDSAASGVSSTLTSELMALALERASAADSSSSTSSTDSTSTDSASTKTTNGTGPQSLEDRFKSMDTDGDGKVSESEFLAAKPDNVSTEDATKLFESLDTSGSGSITEDQMSAQDKGPSMMGGMRHMGHMGHMSGMGAMSGMGNMNSMGDMSSLSSILNADDSSSSDDSYMDDIYNQMSSVIQAYKSAGTDSNSTAAVTTSTDGSSTDSSSAAA